ncbi:hypothetical protein GCM10027404_06060 [Arthrobacter tumbae]|uniref:S-layer homology domain-containing protein n=1 Tax=Arthrobacter tumbae TaxID=163874 RepID=UPI0019566276|nr:S-layer homology domain-containing protein [Arthrobacter tumbae]MBM7779951.1 hypothetical protein [Arthrobacter tumbae]
MLSYRRPRVNRESSSTSAGKRIAAITAAGAVCLPLLVAPSVATAVTTPGGEGLAAVGPIDNANGYPFWYQDKGIGLGDADTTNDVAPLRLELCLEIDMCGAEIPVPAEDIKFPENYPDEGFWWAAEAEIENAPGDRALLVYAQEAAFGDAGAVAVDKQVAFTRQRVRLDALLPNATYTVTTPYGTEEFVTDVEGEINDTQDIGCMSPPCGFEHAMTGHIGPFLRWTDWETDPQLVRETGQYIGDPATPHTVEGGTGDENVFRVEGPNPDGSSAPWSMETDLFSVTGKVAQLKTTIDKPGDLFGAATQVRIQSSFPGESDILYTLDGSDPLGPDGIRVASEALVTIPGPTPEQGTIADTVLRYVAVGSGQTTEPQTHEYRVDTSLPVVTATPSGAAASAPDVSPIVLKGSQMITLTAAVGANADAVSTIYYTTDGTRPRLVDGAPAGSTQEYTGPFQFTRSGTVNAIAVTTDGVTGPNTNVKYTVRHLDVINEPAAPGSRNHPFPTTVKDYGTVDAAGNTVLAPVELALCLNDPNCALEVPFDTTRASYPDNFPSESFWWAADAEIPVGTEGRARLVLALEAAFANEVPRDGDEIAFGRTRYSMRGLTPGVTYRITHPYGVDVLTADTAGDIRYTNDVGCLDVNCSFDLMAQAGIGPLLRQPNAPAGYLGDGATEAPVVGSPFDTNYFQLEAITDAAGAELAEAQLIGKTENFSIVGRLASTPEPELPSTVPDAVAAPVVDAAAAPRIGEAVVQLTAPNDGGSPITGFVVRVTDAAGTQLGALRTAPATATSLTITGLRADIATRFQVAAVNDIGQGAFSPLSEALPALPAPFSDVPQGIQFFTEMAWLADSGITNGWTDGTFRPVTPVNRDAMAAFLYRMAGEPSYSAPTVSPFKDVKPGMEHYKEMAWLAEQGISKGWDDGTFRPTTPVNRDAMAAFLFRMAGSPTEGFEPTTFPDVTTGNEFFDEISWLASTGITTGYPDGTFKPVQSVNRDAMAAFLYRFDVL